MPSKRELYHSFLEYFIYEAPSLWAAQSLFAARAEGTWKTYLTAAKMVWAQSNVMGIKMFPLDNHKLMVVLEAVKPKRWTALQWDKVRGYLKIVAKLNKFVIDDRILMLLEGKSRQNIVELRHRDPRPVMEPHEVRIMLFRIKSMKPSFYQMRALLAIYLAFYTTGRSFDISHLKGRHLEINPDFIRIHWHVR